MDSEMETTGANNGGGRIPETFAARLYFQGPGWSAAQLYPTWMAFGLSGHQAGAPSPRPLSDSEGSAFLSETREGTGSQRLQLPKGAKVFHSLMVLNLGDIASKQTSPVTDGAGALLSI